MPKSASFTSPCWLMSTFCGVTSRCTMPSGLPVALARVDVGEPAAQRADDRRGPAGSAASAWPACARRRICSRLQPSTNSSTRKYWSPDFPRSSTCTRLLWFSVEAMCASSTNMRTNWGSAASAGQDPLEHDRLLEPLLALLQGQEDLRHPAVGDLADHVVSVPRAIGRRIPRQDRGCAMRPMRKATSTGA